MRAQLVYDLPTRIFHLVFAALFISSFTIANVVDDESVIFSYHMLSGILMGGLILWRIYWGIFGSRHAQFASFNLSPYALKDYFLGILSGSKKRWSGHNPASSWATIVMLILGLGLCATGYLISTASKDAYEEIHELMAYSFLAVVILHIAGIVLHSVRHNDGIAFSMADGRKELIEDNQPISSQHTFSAIILVVLLFILGSRLYENFDPTTSTLKLFGNTLSLGENDNESKD